jgi:tripartite-type tricarboxylate transporter receptor subunit TctC
LHTPDEIVTRLSRETSAVLGERAFRDKMLALGIEPAGSSPQQLHKQVENEVDKWAAVIREAGIRKE